MKTNFNLHCLQRRLKTRLKQQANLKFRNLPVRMKQLLYLKRMKVLKLLPLLDPSMKNLDQAKQIQQVHHTKFWNLKPLQKQFPERSSSNQSLQELISNQSQNQKKKQQRKRQTFILKRQPSMLKHMKVLLKA